MFYQSSFLAAIVAINVCLTDNDHLWIDMISTLCVVSIHPCLPNAVKSPTPKRHTGRNTETPCASRPASASVPHVPVYILPATSTHVNCQVDPLITSRRMPLQPNCHSARTCSFTGYLPSSKSLMSLTLLPPIPLWLYTLPYWSNPPFLIFWHSGALALKKSFSIVLFIRTSDYLPYRRRKHSIIFLATTTEKCYRTTL